eukprot:TRINITY_DN96114_c0_g1_i1.p1 TRINITY_DN96114_c0_g1~~TRINITY_DN96114_c0_g1_i1.p1  ORF type:complete len:335 (+),score=81.37 TRINITY_DN96114_c0_g1_i1:131-1135(+)
MSAAAGPGAVPIEIDDLPEGWEAFATNDGHRYFCFPQVYYYCRALGRVQWERPKREDARAPYAGVTINGKKPFEIGDELIPDPPPLKPYDGPLSDANYKASNEDPEDVFQPDEDMLEACVECDMPKLKAALEDGADVSLPNHPWQNTPLHLANCPYFWDADTMAKEKAMRFELSQYLVRQGADLDVENLFHCKPIDFAIFHGYEDTVKFLEEQGSKPSIFGAAYSGDLERVKELLEEGVDIDLQGRYKRTAFAEAHLRGQFAVETFLAQQGCSREIPHPENMKFNPGGAAIPKGGLVPDRQKQYTREEDPTWYDDMMSKRYPRYLDQLRKFQKT